MAVVGSRVFFEKVKSELRHGGGGGGGSEKLTGAMTGPAGRAFPESISSPPLPFPLSPSFPLPAQPRFSFPV